MEEPGRINGEKATKDILKDLIAYRASSAGHESNCKVKNRMREMSDKIKLEMDVKEPLKLEYLLGNVQALEDLITVLYLHAKTEEQQVLFTVGLFTLIAESCKNVSKDSHRIVVDNAIVILKSTVKGRFTMSAFDQMYAREKV